VTEAQTPAPLWTDSRRLFGPSLWLDGPGVVLEAACTTGKEAAEIAAWQTHVRELTSRVGWHCDTATRGNILAFTAPADALLAATMVNEWAWTRAAVDGAARAANTGDLDEPRLPLDTSAAEAVLREHIAREANPALVALLARARARDVPVLFDETELSVGYGIHSARWPLTALPQPDDIEWSHHLSIPVALVTGSNGKTTTVRLVAAMLARAGHTVGYCCSDGVFIDGIQVERGDWSGPAGARLVLRDTRVTAAVLETARGGLLRRGLAVPSADAAIVTNIAEDHFGGYGINSLADLAEAKLVVAHALDAHGTLVLNAQDPTLRTVHAPQVERHRGRTVWFRDDEPTEGVPPADAMPFTLQGVARHNIANAAGAAHVARALGVTSTQIEATLRVFGRSNQDNPGRLERFERNGVRIWIDYAHNPHGMRFLVDAALAERGTGRLGLLLGQAGDRDDEAIRELARTAWRARPDYVVLKDIDGYLRGRAPGDVPALIRDELLTLGAARDTIEDSTDETDGVARLLRWAIPGDLLVLPVHALDARDRAKALIAESH
jgi:UDP-N-acetylmuramyl tripeptide synthase